MRYYLDLVDKIWSKVNSWMLKLLSPGGWVVLIKHVLASFPLHLLAVLAPLMGVLSQIERLFALFLWGQSQFGAEFHWISWCELCYPVNEGGMGFQSLKYLVKTFSCKLWWQFRCGESLWAEFIHAKYCHFTHQNLAQLGYASYPVWL